MLKFTHHSKLTTTVSWSKSLSTICRPNTHPTLIPLWNTEMFAAWSTMSEAKKKKLYYLSAFVPYIHHTTAEVARQCVANSIKNTWNKTTDPPSEVMQCMRYWFTLLKVKKSVIFITQRICIHSEHSTGAVASVRRRRSRRAHDTRRNVVYVNKRLYGDNLRDNCWRNIGTG